MAVVASRIFIFTILPLLLAGMVILLDRSATSRERRLEAVLIFLFGLGVAASGIFGFFGHFFLSDAVAESIGWESGSPFQLEVAFANLTLGALGLVATGRRDGFREATVLAVTIFGVGATIVHIMDIAATGNLALGNTLQNVSNLLKPALLIGALAAARRAEARPDSEAGTAEFDGWRAALLGSTAPIAIGVSTAFGLGFAIGQPWPLTLVGALISFAILAFYLRRSPLHELKWG